MKRLTQLPQSLILLLTLANSAAAVPQRPFIQGSDSQVVLQGPQHQASGSHGAVASESKICSQIGIDLLAKGGNAVDAYIGTQLCVGVIGMHHSGIGGGGFALIRDANGSYTVIDYRETAPESAYEDMYKNNVMGSVFGGLSVGVPGELRGLENAHSKFGVLPWEDVVMPSADVSRNGFPVTEDMVRYMAYGISFAGWNFLVEDPSWAQDFAPHGSLVAFGDVMTRKRYGDTLEKVAKHGADVFYTGAMAHATVSTIQRNNGTMTMDDMKDYEVATREPISITYRGYELYSSGAPSSGAVALSILKTMEGYDIEDNADSNLTIHRFDEAMRFAYGAHQALGDPAYLADIDVLEKSMLDEKKAADIRSRILDNATQPVKHYDPHEIYTAESHGTSHIVTADSLGMAVSSTTTVNLLYGSLLMVPETGVILNDEMNDFSIPERRNEFGYEPSPANFIRSGKRPLSSITPVIVEDGQTGDLYAVVGAAGGSRIISSTTQVVWRVLEHNMTMRESMTEPRLHDQLMPNKILFEYDFDNSTVASLQEKGHEVEWVRQGLSSVQGIRIRGDGAFEAVGEPRQKNSAGLSI